MADDSLNKNFFVIAVKTENWRWQVKKWLREI